MTLSNAQAALFAAQQATPRSREGDTTSYARRVTLTADKFLAWLNENTTEPTNQPVVHHNHTLSAETVALLTPQPVKPPAAPDALRMEAQADAHHAATGHTLVVNRAPDGSVTGWHCPSCPNAWQGPPPDRDALPTTEGLASLERFRLGHRIGTGHVTTIVGREVHCKTCGVIANAADGEP